MITDFAKQAQVAPLAEWVAVLGQRPPRAVEGSVRILPASPDRARKLWLMCEDGGRPSVAESDSCAVVFAGRLHDREKLRALATATPNSPETDAELVLRAYVRQGETALNQLRGAFVVLVWDPGSDRLLAARDPLGQRPLFFTRRSDTILLSMSQDALLRQEGISKEIDRAAAAAWVCARWVHEPFFAAISRLLPGHRLCADARGLRIDPYWRPRVPDRPEPVEEEAVHEHFDLLLSRAVDCCLDIGPGAVFLSGGIDSTAISAVAAERSRQRGLPAPLALSLGFLDPHADESGTQRAVASALAIPQVLLSLDEASGPKGPLLDSLAAAAWMPLPPTIPWMSGFHVLAREAARRGSRVVLSGDGSEWVAHQWEFVADLLRRLDLAGLYEMCAAEHRYNTRSTRWIARTLLWRNGVRALLREAVTAPLTRLGGRSALEILRRRRDRRGISFWIAPDAELRRELVDRWGSIALSPSGPFYARARRSLLDLPEMTVGVDFRYEQSRRLGIELLAPFEDPDLMEFLLSVSPRLLTWGSRPKSLAHATIRRRLPTFDMRLLRSAYFETAFKWLLFRQGKQAFEQLGGIPILSDLGVVDPKAVLTLMSGSDNRGEIRYNDLWCTLSLEAWLQGRL